MVYRLLKRLVDVRPAEIRALGLVLAVHLLRPFFLLYLASHPRRDGSRRGVENLQWLFTGTLLGMIVVNPPFAALVAKLPRVRFIAVTYRFFMVNLLIFILLLHMATAEQHIWVGRLFFIWTSVFQSLCCLRVLGADGGCLRLRARQASVWIHCRRRHSGRYRGVKHYGVTGQGCAGDLSPAGVGRTPGSGGIQRATFVAIVRCFAPAARGRERRAAHRRQRTFGCDHAFKSPYLINVSVYILLFAITSTFLYFQQAEIARQSFADRGARTAFFARVDLWVNVLTLGAQLFLTGRVLRAIGVGLTLAMLPALSVLGFGTLAMTPTIAVLVVYQVLRRAGNFAFASRPARYCLPWCRVKINIKPRALSTRLSIEPAIKWAPGPMRPWAFSGWP